MSSTMVQVTYLTCFTFDRMIMLFIILKPKKNYIDLITPIKTLAWSVAYENYFSAPFKKVTG